MGEDLSLFLADVAVCAIVVGILFVGRRAAGNNQGWRDFLGISMTFVVLAGLGFVMIVGEHFLG